MNVFAARKYREGFYNIDWAMVEKISHAYHMSYYALKFMKWDKEENFWGPDLYNVNVNWGAARAKADFLALKDLNDAMDLVDRSNSISALKSGLREWVHCAGVNRAELKRWTNKAQELNAKNIRESVEDWETAISSAKFVRDASASILMTGATVLSGGAAAAALAGGASLKSVAKYEDTGEADAAVMTFGTQIVVGAFKVGGFGGTLGKDAIVVTIEATGDGLTAWLEGKSAAEAVATGALKFIDLPIGMLAGTQPVKSLLSKIPIPGGLTLTSKQTKEWGEKIGDVALDRGSDIGRGAAVDAMFKKPKTPGRGSSAVLPAVMANSGAMAERVFYRPHGY